MKTRPTIEQEISTLSHKAKIIAYVLGMLEQLRQKGFVEAQPGAVRATEKGELGFEVLKAQGFEPTEEEIKWGVAVINSMRAREE